MYKYFIKKVTAIRFEAEHFYVIGNNFSSLQKRSLIQH